MTARLTGSSAFADDDNRALGAAVAYFRKATLKRRARPLRLFLLDLGLARHRHDPKCGDAVALTAQHTKPETVEGEILAALGNRACLVNHHAADSASTS